MVELNANAIFDHAIGLREKKQIASSVYRIAIGCELHKVW